MIGRCVERGGLFCIGFGCSKLQAEDPLQNRRIILAWLTIVKIALKAYQTLSNLIRLPTKYASRFENSL